MFTCNFLGILIDLTYFENQNSNLDEFISLKQSRIRPILIFRGNL